MRKIKQDPGVRKARELEASANGRSRRARIRAANKVLLIAAPWLLILGLALLGVRGCIRLVHEATPKTEAEIQVPRARLQARACGVSSAPCEPLEVEVTCP